MPKESVNVYFVFLVANLGEIAARFVKIHLELAEMGAGTNLPRLKFNAELNTPTFSVQNNGRDFVFKSGADWQIYPNDFEPFTIQIYPHSNDTATEHLYKFVCSVWAEGIEKPFRQELIVRISEA